MSHLAIRRAVIPVIIALLSSVCLHCVSFNPAPRTEGICALDVCSKQACSVASADFSIAENIFTVHIVFSSDVHHRPPAVLPESVMASPPERPPAA